MLKALWFFACFMLCSIACMKVYDTIHIISIENEKTPESFPVLVTWKNQNKACARAIDYKSLPEFIKSLQNYSFIIPKDIQSEIHEILKNSSRAYKKDPNLIDKTMPWSTDFAISDVYPDGSQRITFWATWDSDIKNLGIYRAEQDKIVPLKHLFYFGPGAALSIFPIAFLLGMITYFITVKLFYYPKVRLNTTKLKENNDVV